MNKQLLTIFLLVLIAFGIPSIAQITSPSASFSTPTVYTNGTPNDVIYGFCTPDAAGAAVTGSLTATAGVANCTFVWTIFDPITNTYNPFTTQAGLTTSTLTGLASGGYHVTIKNGAGTVIACDVAWVWVNQTTASVGAIAAGCSPFNLNGTASAVSNYSYYNPPPEPFTITAATAINVCFSATHTFDSDLGFFLVGPATCGSPTITLSPNPGANGQGSVCNSGDNVNNLCFTTAASPNFDPCSAATPYTGTYDSYGPAGTPTIINWAGLYGCDASEGGWRVQIFDCIGADVGFLTSASMSFVGNGGCGVSTISYNSGVISSAINDNSCTSATASVFTVPSSAAVPIVLIGGNTISYQWTSVPATVIPNATTSLTPSINPVPTVDTWYYLTVTDNYGCVKKDSAFFDYSPPGVPAITPAGPFCVNAAATNLVAAPAGGTWSGTGITNAATGTFNPATAGTGTFTITYTTPGACGGSTTTSIVVDPLPTVTVPANITVCNSAAIAAANFTTTPAGGTVSWTNSNTTIGLAASGPGNIAGFNGTNTGSTVQTATIVVTPTLNGCVGTPSNYTITVNPTPVLTAIASQTVCANANTATINYSTTPASTVNWTNSNNSIGAGANGVGNIAAFAGINAGSTPTTGNFVATPTVNGCVGTAQNFTITVNPIPVIAAVASQTVCAIANTTAITFNPTPATTTVNWTNSDGTIGVGTTGAGDIAAFAGINAGSTPAIGNFVATPTVNGCVGTAQNFTITVNPIPILAAIASQTVCANANTTAITFNPTPAAPTTTINWTNSDGTIGIGTTGTGNIAAFAGINAGSTPITGNFVATPTASGCPGAAQNFSITINPIPVIGAVASQTICAIANTTAIAFNPTPVTTTVNWTNSDGTIGVGTTGAGDIAAFAGINAGSTPAIGNFVATPTVNGCVGTAQNFTITVNPIPILAAIASQTVCANANTTAITFNPTPAAPTTTINWTNTDGTIGIGTTGTGNIAAFAGINAGSTPITGNFIATPTASGCPGAAQNFSITINPIPVIGAVASQTVCANANTTAISFNPTPATTTVNWTNSNGTIGVGTTGAGDIAAFAGTNNGSAPAIGNFVATPTVNGCLGTAQNFTITINHIPTLAAVTSQTVCANANTTLINLTPNPATASVNWTNTNNTIGIGANGTGNIAAFAGVNAGSTTAIGNFVATPSENNCVGTPQNFSITINPLPVLTAVASQTVCPATNTSAITFVTNPVGATVGWTNSDGTIGIGTVGVGDIAAFAGTNAGLTTLTGNFVATPTINSCVGPTINFSISISPLPVPVIGSNSPVCVNSTLNLTSSGGTIYSWTGPDNFTSSSQNPTLANAALPMAGNYIVTVGVGGTCVSTATVTVVVNPLPVVIIGSNSPVCENGTINLTASGGTSYSWSGPPPNSFSSNLQNPSLTSATLSMAANYTVTVTDANNCVNANVTNVVVNPLPIAPVTAPVTYCQNDVPLSLTATPVTGGSLNWYGTNSTGGVASAIAPTPSTSAAVNTSYYVSQSLLNCEGPRSSLLVTVNPLPTATLGAVTSGCVPVCRDFTLSPSTTISSYVWNMGNGTSTTTSPTLNNCYTEPGTYSINITLTDNLGCVSNLPFPSFINAYPNPIANFTYSPDVITISDPSVTFIDQSIGANIASYNWNFGDTLSTTGSGAISDFTYIYPGIYSVQLAIMTINGCVDTIYKPIEVMDEFLVYVPNAFSPNGDGINEEFYPIGNAIAKEKFTFTIFDRWGELIYSTTDYTAHWDGKKFGADEIVQEDTYVYKISCRSTKGAKFSKSGHVNVIR